MTERQLQQTLSLSTLFLPMPGPSFSSADKHQLLWLYLFETITDMCRTFTVNADLRVESIDRESRVLAVNCG